MSEPITLYKDGAAVTVYAPSVARELRAQGWTNEPDADVDDVPCAFKEAYVDEAEFVNISEPVVPVKRGRPKKAAK